MALTASYEILSGWRESVEALLSEGAYVWNNYLGTVLAFVSLIMVFTTDYRLIRRFLSSGRRLKEWLKLLGYTLFRVLFTLWIYYGLGWLADGFLFICNGIWSGLRWLFFFIAGTFTRKGLVHFTTIAVALAFLCATGVAVVEHFVPAARRARERRRSARSKRRADRGRLRGKQKGRPEARPQLGNSEPQYVPQVCEIDPADGDE